jgi:nicotinamide riboside transporter PnuC
MDSCKHTAVIVYLAMNMFPTAVLFAVYTLMAVIGLGTWKKSELKIKN